MWQPPPIPTIRNRGAGGITGELLERPVNAARLARVNEIDPPRDNLPSTVLFAVRLLYCTPDQLVNMFFGPDNVARVQVALRSRVHAQTGGQVSIDDQPEAEMLNAMVAFYRQHARFTPGSPDQRMAAMNEKLLEKLVPKVLTNVYTYLSGLATVDAQAVRANNPVPLPIKADITARQAPVSLART
jgi:hypothetical protein